MTSKIRGTLGSSFTVVAVAGLVLISQWSTSSAAPPAPAVEQVTHTTEPGAVAKDPVLPPEKFSLNKRASTGPESAQAYLRKIGMKPVSISDVGSWTGEDGTAIGVAVRLTVVADRIPSEAPVLEPSRKTCEQESDSPSQCAGRFQPTPQEPYRAAGRRSGQEGPTADVVVLVDQRNQADAIAAVQPVPTRA
jgi:hypothetical protein